MIIIVGIFYGRKFKEILNGNDFKINFIEKVYREVDEFVIGR